MTKTKTRSDSNALLLNAAKKRNIEDVILALETGADVNARDSAGRTALMEASARGHSRIVRTLIEAGADIGTKDDDDCTALHRAETPAIAEILVNSGADMEAKSRFGLTPEAQMREDNRSNTADYIKDRLKKRKARDDEQNAERTNITEIPGGL